jgi:class 3 adenylate cyclase/predicted ATPase
VGPSWLSRRYGLTVGGVEAEGAKRVTMAFLFTDIVGSTALWERFPEAMPSALRRHDALLEDAVSCHEGVVVHRAGDGMIASFPTVAAAADAAVTAQLGLIDAEWSDLGELGVRMGVHCGPVVVRDGNPYGWALNFGARLTDVGSAGQILVSGAAVAALGESGTADHEAMPIATVRLRDIAEAVIVHQLLAPGLPQQFPALRDTRAPAPLPVSPDELVGRSADLVLLDRLMRSNRLLTLAGPPGVGTSRLGTELVNRTLAHFPDGAVRVDLVGANAPAAEAVAHAVGVRSGSDQSVIEALSESLRGRRIALLVDRGDLNDDDLRHVVESVLVAAPSVTFVCTGRSPLGIPGEVVHRVDPLAPDEALRLIERRAPAAAARAHEGVLREIVRELDGLPLALEVAAAAAAVYSWDEVLDMLRDTDPGHPNSPGGGVAIPVATGFEDLPARLRSMLTAATVFAGPFDRSAFAVVCASDLDAASAAEGLGQLVDRSLVSREAASDRTQFRLLRPVREVVERHGPEHERRAAERRLAKWAIQFVGEAAAGLRGSDERLWNRRVGSQFGNLRAAFERSVERGDLATAAVLATSLWDFGFMRFHQEYLGWSLRLVDRFPDAPPELIGPVHGVAALSAWIGDDLDGVVEHADRALELEATHELDFDLPARLALISAAVYSGATGPPEQVYAESADYQLDRPEAYFHVNVDTQNSVMARWLGDHEAAIRYAVRALKKARESENGSSIAFALWALGGALADDDPLSAETHLGTAIELARGVGNRWVAALTQMSLVSIRHRTAGPTAAAPILLDLLEVLMGVGHRTHLWSSLRLASVILADLGDDDLAVQVAAWVRNVGLAMPAFASEQALLDATGERILTDRGAEWVGRMELMSSTWTPSTATTLVRDALARHLDVP